MHPGKPIVNLRQHRQAAIPLRSPKRYVPIRDYVCVHERRYPRQILVGNGMPRRSQLIRDLGNAQLVPDQHGIRQQAEAARLFMISLASPLRNSPQLAKKRQRPQLVTRFTPVQLQLDAMAQCRIGQIAQNENRLHHAAKRRQRSSQSI